MFYIGLETGLETLGCKEVEYFMRYIKWSTVQQNRLKQLFGRNVPVFNMHTSGLLFGIITRHIGWPWIILVNLIFYFSLYVLIKTH